MSGENVQLLHSCGYPLQVVAGLPWCANCLKSVRPTPTPSTATSPLVMVQDGWLWRAVGHAVWRWTDVEQDWDDHPEIEWHACFRQVRHTDSSGEGS